jgi:hypothetical protein
LKPHEKRRSGPSPGVTSNTACAGSSLADGVIVTSRLPCASNRSIALAAAPDHRAVLATRQAAFGVSRILKEPNCIS